MGWTRRLLAAVLIGLLSTPFSVLNLAHARSTDPWVHPRGEHYQAGRHYNDGAGELYYLEENDIGTPDAKVSIEVGDTTSVSVPLNQGLLQVAERTSGALLPVLLYDRNGDGRVDRGVFGRIEGRQVHFDAEELSSVDFSSTYWQIGVRYAAGATGSKDLDGRYLASLDSNGAAFHIRDRSARALEPVAPEPVAQEPVAPEPEPVAATPAPAPVYEAGYEDGLVIFKHRESDPFDFADFVEHPARYIEGFDALTRTADGDDWTANEHTGELRTHFADEDLFLVRTEGDFDLALRWGDLEIEEFLRDVLHVSPNGDGCYSTLHSELKNADGTDAVVPHRLLFCPEMDVALFDVPDGYEIEVLALRRDGGVHESTVGGTTISDNVRLYIHEVNPRHASARATGSVSGNIGEGFRDAGGSLRDAGLHLITGTNERNIHTGRIAYRPSPVTAPPRAVFELATGHPLRAFGQLVQGSESAIQVIADLVAALETTFLNPIIQTSVGLAASPQGADRVGDSVGAFLQAVVKNLPFGERSTGMLDLRTSWYHDRGWEPSRWTRTDTQLNIDRTFTLLDSAAASAVANHSSGSSGCSGCSASDSIPLPGDSTPETPGALLPGNL